MTVSWIAFCAWHVPGAFPGADPESVHFFHDVGPARASLRDEIEMLDRIIAWQIKTIIWHRDEGRRLREQATQMRTPGPGRRG
jgi:hypothetical protein